MKFFKGLFAFLKRCLVLVNIINIFIILMGLILYQHWQLLLTIPGLVGLISIIIGLWYTHYFFDTINAFYYIFTNKEKLFDASVFIYEPDMAAFIIIGLLLIFLQNLI